MGESGTHSVSKHVNTQQSGSNTGSITVTPTRVPMVAAFVPSITVSPQSPLPSPSGSQVQRSSIAAYSSTASVSETVGPMPHEVPANTSAVTEAYFIAFIVTPILSFVFVILVIVLIVGIVKLKKGDQRKSRATKSPDKIEGTGTSFIRQFAGKYSAHNSPPMRTFWFMP